MVTKRLSSIYQIIIVIDVDEFLKNSKTVNVKIKDNMNKLKTSRCILLMTKDQLHND